MSRSLRLIFRRNIENMLTKLTFQAKHDNSVHEFNAITTLLKSKDQNCRLIACCGLCYQRDNASYEYIH